MNRDDKGRKTDERQRPPEGGRPIAGDRTVLGLLSSVLCLLSSVFICGCEADDGNAPMEKSFYLNPYKDVHSLGRVALVELENLSEYPNITSEMTTALHLALQKKQLFGLNIIRQNDPLWQSLRQKLESLDGLKQIGTMRESLKSDAILIGTVTQYQPYPRMVVGLRLTLLDLTDGDVLWGLEQVWDSSDNSTRKRIKHWAGAASLREELVVMSSLNFSKFIAYEAAQTFELSKPAEQPAPTSPVRSTWQY
jgi:hypothetical protein